MSKIKEIARAEKSMREAENKLKRANEQLQINAKREEELNALAKALDREKEELRKKAQTASNEDLDGVVTAFDHKVRSLHQQIKDLKENEKKLQSKITKLEARSRGNSSAVSPKPQSRPRTDATKGDISKNEGWVAQYLDSENPTREELSQEAVRLSEVQKDLETRIEAYTQIKSDSELKLVDLELRQEKLAAREDALSKLMSKFGGLEDMTEDKFENLQEQFKTEMEAMVAEHESAKAEHRVRQELFERQIRDLEESCTRRVELLSSKSNIIEYVQKIDNAAVEHSDYLQHSENLKTLVADPKTDISHLVALQEMYQEKLADITTQVEERKFLLEEPKKQEQDSMRDILKTVEDKEHEYLAQIAAQGAYNLPQRPVRKNPEKVSSLPAIFPSLTRNPAQTRMGGGFSMNRHLARSAPVLRQSVSAIGSRNDMTDYIARKDFPKTPLKSIPEPMPMGHDQT